MSLRHAVLGLLSVTGPASGYDLLQIFRGSLENVWPAAQSQLYTELGKLDEADLVTVVAEGVRGRKEYALTEAGQAELLRWLTEVEPSTRRRSDMLLRVFFFSLLSPAQVEEFLRRRAAAAAEYHAELSAVREQIRADTGPLADNGRLALEWGLRHTAMEKEWAEWAIGEYLAGRSAAEQEA